MEVKRYCPFCKTEHDVTYEGTCCIQYMDGASLRVYRCNKVNRSFKTKEHDKL
jgi:hypothetical protein